MDYGQLALELFRGLFIPLIVAAITSVSTVFIMDRYKAGKQFKALLENLRREMNLALLSHPANRESALQVTGAFVRYPVSTAERILFEPVTTKSLSPTFVNSLQDYLKEALRINSLIENAKLLIGAGQHLGASGMPGSTTQLLRKALDSESTIEALIEGVLMAMPVPSDSQSAKSSPASNEAA